MLSEIDPRYALAFFQGLYFFVTGLWAIVHIRSFMAVTGPKTDVWLVKTVGAMITVVGATLMAAGYHANVTSEIVFLAVGSAGALAFVDVYYVAKGTISRIYLLDAVAEAAIIGLWFMFGIR